MVIKRIIHPDYREGVDRKLLKILRDRFLKINQHRLDRARETLALRHKDVLKVLPFFFHLNHPLMPGYVSHDTPWGVANYQPEKTTLQSVQRFSRTFRYKVDRRHPADIQALFMMGSVGSIAHTSNSDIDIWLCYRSGLSAMALADLQRKAERITGWAEETGLEVHFFLMDAPAFCVGEELSKVDEESSGSAQHSLLLDEFYRTSVLLAGCYPLWWLVPPHEESNYEEISHLLLNKRFIKSEDVIDFGGIAHIPPEEFVGSGMWQLYKGIDSPYKSVLKLLLIEAYARELSVKPCLSLEFKQAVYADELDVSQLDPYVMIYQRLESYLSQPENSERLELVRRSFYLKVGKSLSARNTSRFSWQADLMAEMVAKWGWNIATLSEMDNRRRWKVPEVIRERKRVVNQLTHSYRFLSQYARANKLKATINTEDMNILGRKLYAVFQRKAGKVELLNSGIAPDLHEDNLAFHHRSSQGFGDDGQGWLLYRDLNSSEDVFYQPVLKRATSLLELISWCCFNGLLDSATRISLEAGNTSVRKDEIRKIIDSFRQLIVWPLPDVPHEIYRKRVCLVQTLLFVNLGVEPLAELTAKGIHRLSDRNDSLGYSSLRDNLVMTLDQVSVNSWNEVTVYRYELGDTLIQCLKNYLAKLVEQNAGIPRLDVRCFCLQRAMAISERVQILFQDVTHYFLGSNGNLSSRYVVEMDRRFFVIQFFDRQPRFTGLDSLPELLKYLGQTYPGLAKKDEKGRPEYSAIKIDRHAIRDEHCLQCVCAASGPDAIQVFYRLKKVLPNENRPTLADIYVVDEVGALFCYEAPFNNTESLLAPLHRFLSTILERRQMQQPLDGSIVDTALHFFELVAEKDKRGVRAESREVKLNSVAFFVDVQAIGSHQFDGQLEFDIFCDQQEFSSMEYGDELILAVAHYIYAKRKPGEFYPCYITDLGLPNDLDLHEYHSDLQTIQYLRYKLEIESRLNDALKEINQRASIS